MQSLTAGTLAALGPEHPGVFFDPGAEGPGLLPFAPYIARGITQDELIAARHFGVRPADVGSGAVRQSGKLVADALAANRSSPRRKATVPQPTNAKDWLDLFEAHPEASASLMESFRYLSQEQKEEVARALKAKHVIDIASLTKAPPATPWYVTRGGIQKRRYYGHESAAKRPKSTIVPTAPVWLASSGGFSGWPDGPRPVAWRGRLARLAPARATMDLSRTSRSAGAVGG